MYESEALNYIMTQKAYAAEIALTTAYSELDSCHYENCAMASGKRAYIGAVACPREIELGTRVNIDGTWYVCEDRYQKDLSYRFDIFFGYATEAHQAAKEYGRKELLVFIEN